MRSLSFVCLSFVCPASLSPSLPPPSFIREQINLFSSHSFFLRSVSIQLTSPTQPNPLRSSSPSPLPSRAHLSCAATAALFRRRASTSPTAATPLCIRAFWASSVVPVLVNPGANSDHLYTPVALDKPRPRHTVVLPLTGHGPWTTPTVPSLPLRSYLVSLDFSQTRHTEQQGGAHHRTPQHIAAHRIAK